MADAVPPCPLSPRSPARASAWPVPVPETRGGSAHGAQDAAAALGIPRTDYRILLVDDDAATLMAMKRHLIRMRGPVRYQGTCRQETPVCVKRALTLPLRRQ